MWYYNIAIKPTKGVRAMLRIISGSMSSDRDEQFCGLIKKSAENGQPVLVIVPDQYSFESDKKIYNKLGAKAFNSITTAGFNRLAEIIGKAYGSRSAENAAENSKIIIMYKAVSRFSAEKGALYYERSLKKGRFIYEMISLVNELQRSGITPEDLRIASERLDGIISRKLYDISVISKYYLEGLAQAGLRDSVTALSDALRLAKDHGYFKEMSVFIDGFTSFSYDEYRMLDTILCQSEEMTVSLLLGRVAGDAENPFSVTVRTEDRLINMAKEHNIRLVHSICDPKPDSSITSVFDGYFCGDKSAVPASKGLKVISGNDIYDELEYICSEIERLVREENYSYKDIAVAFRQPETVSAALEGIFERYQIPYFIDRAVKADSSAIVIYLKNIFECVSTRHYRTDAIMRYIKSPLCPIYDFDIAALEDYCITYNVEGDMWLEPFCAHDAKTHISSRLEEIRASIIDPLEKFRLASINASAAELCRAFFDLLDTIKVSDQVYSVVKRASSSANETQIELARANKQLWMTVLGAFKSIHDELGDEKLTVKKLYELFKLMTSRMTVSAPPQKLDSVRCINAESSRLDNVKVLFLAEANEGVFPSEPKSEGLFSEREKQLLSDVKIELQNTAANYADNERLVVYRTLCLPREKLYVLYSETDGRGKLKTASSVVSDIISRFKSIVPERISDMPLSMFCTSYVTAYFKYLEHSKDKLVVEQSPELMNAEKAKMLSEKKLAADIAATVEAALRSDRNYDSKISSLSTQEESIDHRISKETSKKLFVKDKLELSATKINDFYYCPFSYFCKHGLKLRMPHKIEFNALYKGNYLHRCIESLMTDEKDGARIYNKNFVLFTDEQLKEKIHSSFLKYEAEEIGGSYGKSASYYAELEEYEKTVFNNIKLIQKEFSDSGFVPEFFEYELKKDGEKSILQLKITDELTVELRGSIDRVDTYTDDEGRKYIRIVDYKTGATDLKLEALYHGLNLQMLIYLLAMTAGNSAEPAGVQYSHIKDADIDLLPDDPADDEQLTVKRLKSYKPDGLFVGEQKLINALNKSYGGAFTVMNFNKDMSIAKNGRQPVSELFLRATEEFAVRKIENLANKLMDGNIAPKPVINGGFVPCTSCDHYAVCGKVLRGEPEEVKTGDREKFNEEIEKICDEMKGGEGNA